MVQTGAHVSSHDVAFRVDIVRQGGGSAGEINRSEASPAHQKTVGQTCAHVLSHDVAARVDPEGLGAGSAGNINRGELAPAQQKTMVQTGAHVPSHDVAARVDPEGLGAGSAGKVNRGEGGVRTNKVRCHAQREAKREQVDTGSRYRFHTRSFCAFACREFMSEPTAARIPTSARAMSLFL